MFWYIWFSVIPISAITLMIFSHKRKWFFPPYMILLVSLMVLAYSTIPMVNGVTPSPKDSTLIETLPIEQLNSENTNKYILIDGEEYSFKAIVTNEHGIEEKKLFTTTHSYTYFKFDSSIERGEPVLEIYEPNTTFWYPEAWLNSGGKHNFYVITLPSQDVLELKLNYWGASD